MQLCRNCRYLYPVDAHIPCLSCDSTHLTIPCPDNLTGIVERLLDRGVDVVSANSDVFDAYDDKTDKTGKIVLLQIELGFWYPAEMFKDLPPDWMTYEYHTVQDNAPGPAYTGLSHSERIFDDDDDELEYATALTISNLESWLDNLDADAIRCIWTLAGYIYPLKYNT